MRTFATLALAATVSAMHIHQTTKEEDNPMHAMVGGALQLAPMLLKDLTNQALRENWTTYEIMNMENPCGEYEKANKKMSECSNACWGDRSTAMTTEAVDGAMAC